MLSAVPIVPSTASTTFAFAVYSVSDVSTSTMFCVMEGGVNVALSRTPSALDGSPLEREERSPADTLEVEMLLTALSSTRAEACIPENADDSALFASMDILISTPDDVITYHIYRIEAGFLLGVKSNCLYFSNTTNNAS